MNRKNLETGFIILLIIADLLPFFFRDFPLYIIFTLSIVLNFPLLGLIFKFYIIPDIEKKTQQKLVFGMYMLFILRSVAKWGEITDYIIRKYLFFKFGYKWLLRIPKNNALYKINYSVEQMSKFEIFIGSYYVGICITVVLICIAFQFHWDYTPLDVINYFKIIYEKLF